MTKDNDNYAHQAPMYTIHTIVIQHKSETRKEC